jgi:hypothetical protein
VGAGFAAGVLVGAACVFLGGGSGGAGAAAHKVPALPPPPGAAAYGGSGHKRLDGEEINIFSFSIC